MTQFKDFDEAVNQEPVRFKVAGKHYELPADLRAGPVLELIRSQAGPEDPKTGVKFLEQVVGKEALDTMIGDGLTLRQLNALSSWIAQVYGLDTTEQEAGVGSPNP